MRWFWIDRFLEFESGRSATAVKTISLGEEQLNANVPGYPTMPASLIVEGVAQTGGLLVGEHGRFQQRVVLAKIGKAVFHSLAVPGDTLTYRAEVDDIRPDGAVVRATSSINDRIQAEVHVVFAYLDDRFRGVKLFADEDFVRLLRILRIYEVGRDQDGNPLKLPQHLIAAESSSVSR